MGYLLPSDCVLRHGIHRCFNPWGRFSWRSFAKSISFLTLLLACFFIDHHASRPISLLRPLFSFSSFDVLVGLASSHVAARIRRAYLSNVLRQPAEYFESTGPGEVASRMVRDIGLVQTGKFPPLPFVPPMCHRLHQVRTELMFMWFLNLSCWGTTWLHHVVNL